MQLKKGQVIDLEILRLAFGGRGIGKYEGMTVFVDQTIPGDKIRASLTKLKPKYFEADLVEIVEPSKDRIEPKCPHFWRCGGCQVQYIPYEQQLEIKKQHVVDAFERIGKIYNPPVNDPTGAKDHFFYRNKMEFSFGYDVEMNFALGFHIPGRRFDILDVDICYLQSERSYKLVNDVRDFMKNKGWPPFKFSCGEGFLRSLFVREGKETGDFMVNLSTSDDVPEDFEEGLSAFMQLLKNHGVTSSYWTQTISKRGTPKQVEEKHLFGKREIQEIMTLENGDKLTFDILPQAFFQVNTTQAEILYSQVLNFALKDSHDTVFDLFCGTGTIGLFLAKHVKEVYGIEINEDAVKSARENARKNNIHNIDFFVGSVDKILKTIKRIPSLIVVDPPRAGLTEKMIEQINDFGSARVIYVSCNPSTLARDCEWLSHYGYKVKEIQPVDMFPQTYHIENVCLLERLKKTRQPLSLVTTLNSSILINW